MGVIIQAVYEGGLRCKAVHTPSGATLVTDAPVDNHGRGESFSPTDLLATASLTCMMTIMGIAAEKEKVDIRGLKASTEKIMSSDLPRRVARLLIRLEIPGVAEHETRRKLEAAARACPVHKSISPEIELDIEFSWL
ncbi:MAG: hypothetical protein RL095_727 [Verrucomicrobiota bacterium]|jgi:putative redox protein